VYSSSGNPRESAIVRGKWLPTGTKPARGSNLVRGVRLEPGQMKSSERAVKAAHKVPRVQCCNVPLERWLQASNDATEAENHLHVAAKA
jgi:hypothetical protein